VGDEVMLDVAMINEASVGMASKLITARLLAIGFELPTFSGAAQSFALFATMIETAYRRRRQ
jgi:hypothetical protein